MRHDARVEALLERARRAECERRVPPDCVSSDAASVRHALARVDRDGLARGRVFCEWGSGTGVVTVLAALMAFEAHGIEIDRGLVESSRRLAADLGVDATFAHGSYLLPGDEGLLDGAVHTCPRTGTDAYAALGLAPGDCDVVFHYPWPGEEALTDRLFVRHTSPGALLMTFHDVSRVLVQSHVAERDEPLPLGWM